MVAAKLTPPPTTTAVQTAAISTRGIPGSVSRRENPEPLYKLAAPPDWATRDRPPDRLSALSYFGMLRLVFSDRSTAEPASAAVKTRRHILSVALGTVQTVHDDSALVRQQRDRTGD